MTVAHAETAATVDPEMPVVKAIAGDDKFVLTENRQRLPLGYAGERNPPLTLLLFSKEGPDARELDRMRLSEVSPYGNFSARLLRTGGHWYVYWSSKSCSDCINEGFLYGYADEMMPIMRRTF